MIDKIMMFLNSRWFMALALALAIATVYYLIFNSLFAFKYPDNEVL